MGYSMELILYSTTENTRCKALCKLTQGIVDRGHNVMFYASDRNKLNIWYELLWTYEQVAFLPHVWSEDSLAQKTPVVLDTQQKKPSNGADILVVCENEIVDAEFACDFVRVVYMYDPEVVDIKGVTSPLNSEKVIEYKKDNNGKWLKI